MTSSAAYEWPFIVWPTIKIWWWSKWFGCSNQCLKVYIFVPKHLKLQSNASKPEGEQQEQSTGTEGGGPAKSQEALASGDDPMLAEEPKSQQLPEKGRRIFDESVTSYCLVLWRLTSETTSAPTLTAAVSSSGDSTVSSSSAPSKPQTVTILKLDAPIVRREQQQWYDVGIIKGTSCLVTHFFLPSDLPLEDQYGVRVSADIFGAYRPYV